VILEPGKALDSLFVILDGTVEISQRGGALVVAKQNEVLGAWALFDPEPMPVTAKTLENTRLLRISRDDFYDLLADNMEITAAIFSMLVRRFRQLVQE
jgi:CRP-like cAMP-binding protein